MVASSIYLPNILRIGAGASGQLAEVLAELGASRPMLVTDPFMQQCGYVDRIVQCLKDGAIEHGVFADCVPDPTTDSVAAAVRYWQQGDFDAVVALGGGSSIDTAKAVAVLAIHGGAMRDYKAPNPVPVGAPIIAIPTTAGTGSEATRVTVVTDTETQEKMMCLGVGLMPSAALVDFELTMSMPYRLTADTGIDSLCHAMEAYVSRKANTFTDSIALASMSAIARHIRSACDEPDNRAAREAMMLAATQGGMAFSNASVTLIHGMSRPLGAFFHVPHGLSNAMLMPQLTEFSLPGATQRYADCARAMGLASAADSDKAAGIALLDGLYQLNADLSVPSPQAYGIDNSRYMSVISTMAQQALASGSPNNNPLIPDQQQIEALYSSVWQ
ncbi:iron-containing alcohol dehydrogenase [Oceanicoccus sagamiensis]|uniref:Alcohol dehydrogenase n=1 Tax=Oceanicoccus sagamiensis TaxID=716816 RepID=A0A1X9NCW3_9GAMM|nr:iron-containing alcohol dehydrogenase [Oceanicoccus sagamiensis]ARN73745.1 alcohol dehydrogenase [Oceanicoccus sagamiensis]